ncbi:MAG: hypothetical protein KBE04_14080 [Phycisphaerae bacterium]|nr:hypothetical protein [Phycisphaerae bacterium]
MLPLQRTHDASRQDGRTRPTLRAARDPERAHRSSRVRKGIYVANDHAFLPFKDLYGLAQEVQGFPN